MISIFKNLLNILNKISIAQIKKNLYNGSYGKK
ncbi:Uncharacterised protein [Streptococcus lutetiensis]|nr:Uncharacterised protein [Streptococcus lutetiensis]VTT05640.1 Uncharacterised protein [Streptococcus lutetiensis]